MPLPGQRARKALNQAFFTRFYIDWDENGPFVALDQLTSTIEPLVSAHRYPAEDEKSGGLVLMDDAAAGDLSPSLPFNARSFESVFN